MAAGAGATFLIRTLPAIGNETGQLLGFYSVIGTFAAGVLSSSYCLLRIRNETLTRSETLARLILYAIGMVVAYIGILFAGCGTLSILLN